MSIDLQPIEIDCGATNPSGVVSLELIPREWVESFPGLNQQTNRLFPSIVLLPNKSWLNVSFSPGSIKFDSQLIPDDQSGLYSNTVDFQVPSDKASISATLEHYKRHLFVARIKEKSGNIKIMGSKKNPCVFKYSYTSGKKVGDFKGYKVKIEQLSTSKPPLSHF